MSNLKNLSTEDILRVIRAYENYIRDWRHQVQVWRYVPQVMDLDEFYVFGQGEGWKQWMDEEDHHEEPK